MIRIHTVIAVF